jgi:probable F420-dependent oxidoreductase
MTDFGVGIQLQPQGTTVDAMRDAWRNADDLGVDTIWTWDHFYPLFGDPDARFGALVGCLSYRNPDLLADMARTVDHLSGGRLILGLGSGWFERDYTEYGYEFGTAGGRLRALGEALPRIRTRLARLNPPPVGDLPVMIGGGGEKVTLRLVAEHAQLWNTFGPPESFAHKNAVLDEHCAAIGRDPADIERTVAIGAHELDAVDAYLEAGATHVILMCGAPFDLAPLQQLLDRRP